MNSFKLGIAGLGTVGVGVVKMLQQNAELISVRAGRDIEIISVTAGSRNKDRGVDLSSYDWVESLSDMAKDERLDAVVEVIGGSEGVVKEFVEEALQNGKHVITANKALLAHHGFALAEKAEKNNVGIAYEAAVAGGIPVIKSLREGLSGNRVTAVYGILNGTCNYILTEMRETGRDFADVLSEAQEKGYAEADPTFDVDGIDAAHKLVLLGALAFGVKPDFAALKPVGVRDVTSEDIQFAEEFGYRIKLIGMAKQDGDDYFQSLEPCFVPKGSALGSVEGVFNAVLTQGDFVDQTMMEGRGAGEGPTASAVLSDIVDLARGNVLPTFGAPVAQLKPVVWGSRDTGESEYYLRLVVEDHSGVLADLTACLKELDISIDQAIQRGDDAEERMVAILTHECSAVQIEKALNALGSLPCVVGKPTCMRLEKI